MDWFGLVWLGSQRSSQRGLQGSYFMSHKYPVTDDQRVAIRPPPISHLPPPTPGIPLASFWIFWLRCQNNNTKKKKKTEENNMARRQGNGKRAQLKRRLNHFGGSSKWAFVGVASLLISLTLQFLVGCQAAPSGWVGVL